MNGYINYKEDSIMKNNNKEVYFVEYDRYPNRPLALLQDLYQDTLKYDLDYTKGDRLTISMQSGNAAADEEYQAKLEWLFLHGYLNYLYDNQTRELDNPFSAVVTLTPKGIEEASEK